MEDATSFSTKGRSNSGIRLTMCYTSLDKYYTDQMDYILNHVEKHICTQGIFNKLIIQPISEGKIKEKIKTEIQDEYEIILINMEYFGINANVGKTEEMKVCVEFKKPFLNEIICHVFKAKNIINKFRDFCNNHKQSINNQYISVIIKCIDRFYDDDKILAEIFINCYSDFYHKILNNEFKDDFIKLMKELK
jgi:hypothetical protein